MRYLVTRDCVIDGVPHDRGDIIIIEHPQHAADIASASEGLLVPMPEQRAPDAPQHDRQIKTPKGKR